MPDVTKSRDTSMNNNEFSSFLKILMKQNSFLFQATSCHFSVEVFTRGFKSCNDCGVAEGKSCRYNWINFSIFEQSKSLPKR